MLAVAGPEAAPLAALLADRDPLGRGAPVDLDLRLKALREGESDRQPHAVRRDAVARIRAEARRLARQAEGRGAPPSPAEMAALAYPDRIGLRRKGDAPRYLLSGGKGAVMPEGDPMAAARLIVATDLDGDPREARIRQAIRISEAELRAIHGDRIGWEDVCRWDRRARRVTARRQDRFGALVLDDRHWTEAPPEAMARAMLDGVRELGLVWTDAARRFAARVGSAAARCRTCRTCRRRALMAELETWLLPFLGGVTTAEAWRGFDMLEALRARLTWDQMQALDRMAPAHFTTPLGRRIPIDYGAEPPEITLRLQEMFGQTTHPVLGGTPLRVTLLSPGGKPVQTTTDLPGFWASSYRDVRKEMRGRYPKHPWPEDPTEADPTLRAKRRGAR